MASGKVARRTAVGDVAAINAIRIAKASRSAPVIDRTARAASQEEGRRGGWVAPPLFPGKPSYGESIAPA